MDHHASARSGGVDDRTVLAGERTDSATHRTLLATDRTILAWYRTAFGAYVPAIGFGSFVPSLAGPTTRRLTLAPPQASHYGKSKGVTHLS